jgi:hypothetical protein
MIRRAIFTGAFLSGLLLSSCGGGSDVGIDQAVAVVEADWMVVDLATGAIDPRGAVADLASNDSYRTTHIVLRRIQMGSAVVGAAPGERWAQDDEPRSAAAPAAYFISAFELTRGHWRRLAATTPWRDVTPASLAGLADDDHLPACGLSLDQVQTVCTSWNKAGRWSVPSHVQWEVACRAGADTSFAWGEQIDEATVAQYAMVRQTAGSNEGPQPVGTRAANAFGLYDLHGNVWEWTAGSELRGGSWYDGLPLARAANRVACDRSTPHALAGARLVYAP